MFDRYTLDRYRDDRAIRSRWAIVDKQHRHLERWCEIRKLNRIEERDQRLLTSLAELPPHASIEDWREKMYLEAPSPSLSVPPHFLNLLYSSIHQIEPTAIEPYYGEHPASGAPIVGRCRG